MMTKYFNPSTDFGFKKLFGEEANKDILINFLNEVLREEHQHITDIQYLKTEQLGLRDHDRKAIFDLYCTNKKGEHFIVEMQKARQEFFKDRALYYSTFPIQQQVQKGETWNYELKPVYMIAILNFEINDSNNIAGKYKTTAKISDKETNATFYEKLTYIFIELPKFTKKLEETKSPFEEWLYVLKYLPTFDRMPDKLKETIFKKVFKIAELGNLSDKQLNEYNDSLKQLWDMQNVLDTAFDEGKAEGETIGIQKANLATAKQLKELGIAIDIIMQTTKLTEEEIKKL